MPNRRLINSFVQLLPRTWLERKSSARKPGDKLINRPDYKKKLNPDLPFHEQIKNQAIYSLISTVEPHFEIIHDLLIWKYPDQSIAAFLGINVFYWFIVFISSHLVTAVAFVIFLYKVEEFWSTVVWPEISLEPSTPPEQENWTCVDPNLLSAPEITRFVDSCLNWVKNRLIAHWNLRSTNHLAFFLINLLVFTGLGYLGTFFSGAVIIWFILIATLLAPGINVHLFPFFKSSDKESNKENLNESDKLKSDEKDKDNLNSSSSKELNDTNERMDKEKRNSPKLNDEDNLDKASKLFGQILENTKCYLNHMFDEKATNESPTEEFIKKKEVELNKAHDFLTDVVLNQDPSFPVDNNELNNSFKYLENEFKKLDKLKDSVKLNQKSNNSIESNLVASHFDNDIPILSDDGEDDFEIIPSPSYQ